MRAGLKHGTRSVAAQKNLMQRVGLVLGPVLFILINFLDLEPGNPAVTRMAAVAALMYAFDDRLGALGLRPAINAFRIISKPTPASATKSL